MYCLFGRCFVGRICMGCVRCLLRVVDGLVRVWRKVFCYCKIYWVGFVMYWSDGWWWVWELLFYYYLSDWFVVECWDCWCVCGEICLGWMLILCWVLVRFVDRLWWGGRCWVFVRWWCRLWCWIDWGVVVN